MRIALRDLKGWHAYPKDSGLKSADNWVELILPPLDN